MTSDVEESDNQINANYEGAGKNALRAISEISVKDKHADDITMMPNGQFTYDYYLDNPFNGDVAPDDASTTKPALHYFKRGFLPAEPKTDGLTVKYNVRSDAQTRSMLSDFNFPRDAHELVTRVRIQFLDASDQSQNTQGILINHEELPLDLSLRSGVVRRIPITNRGTGYPTGTTVNIDGAGGTGATATVTVVNGEIASINVMNGGTGLSYNWHYSNY